MKIEEIRKFYLKYKFYLFPAIVAISSLILIVFVIYPQMASLIINQAVEKSSFDKSKFLEAKAQALESYDVSDLNRKVGFAISSYPTERDSIYAIGVLQGLMAKVGFNIISISQGASIAKSGNIQSYSFKVEVLGPLSRLPFLLNTIESSPRLMRISGMDVGGSSAQGVSVSLGVDLLFGSAPLGFGSIDSPLPTLSEKDGEIIAKLVRSGIPSSASQANLSNVTKGKSNPFE